MEANFQRALSLALQSEGGWSNDKKDPGGCTMKGITLATFRRYQPKASAKDLRNISDEMIGRIYRDGYWKPVEGDKLPSGLDYCVFDFGVNSGCSRAAKYVQRIVGAKVDGKIGPMTLKRVAMLEPAFIINQLCDDRLQFLRGLPTWEHFGHGWTRRVEAVRAAALAMVPDSASGGSPVPPPDHSIPIPTDRPKVSAAKAAVTAGVVGAGSLAVWWGDFTTWCGHVWHWLGL